MKVIDTMGLTYFGFKASKAKRNRFRSSNRRNCVIFPKSTKMANYLHLTASATVGYLLCYDSVSPFLWGIFDKEYYSGFTPLLDENSLYNEFGVISAEKTCHMSERYKILLRFVRLFPFNMERPFYEIFCRYKHYRKFGRIQPLNQLGIYIKIPAKATPYTKICNW